MSTLDKGGCYMNRQIKSPFMVVLGVLVINFLGLFSETALNIALPQIGKSFQVSSGQTQWLVLGYTMVVGIVLPLTTLISRWVKPKIILAFAAIVFILGSLIAVLAPTFAWLFIGRTIQGISTGLFIPLLFAVTLLVYPANKLGSAMGIIAVVMNFAPALGPSLSGIIVNCLSWRWIFIIFIPIAVVALILILLTVPDVIKQTKPEVHFLSVLYSVLGFGLLITAVGMFSDYGFKNIGLYALLAVAILFVVIYVRRQLKLPAPILNFKIFHSKKYALATIIASLNFAMVMAAMYILPQMLQSGLQFSVSEAGLILLPAGVVNAFVALMAGRLYDSFGAKGLVQIGAILALIGILLLLRVQAGTSLWYIIGVDIILMAGSGLLLSPAQSYGLGDLGDKDSNDGSTIMNTLQQVFGALSVSVATTFLIVGQHASQSSSGAVRYVAGAHVSFLWVTVLLVCLTFFAFRLVDERRQ